MAGRDIAVCLLASPAGYRSRSLEAMSRFCVILASPVARRRGRAVPVTPLPRYGVPSGQADATQSQYTTIAECRRARRARCDRAPVAREAREPRARSRRWDGDCGKRAGRSVTRLTSFGGRPMAHTARDTLAYRRTGRESTRPQPSARFSERFVEGSPLFLTVVERERLARR